MTSVIVSNIPPECTRDDLLEAFPKNVNYLLFPLGTDFSKCVIEFKDASGLMSSCVHKRKIKGKVLETSPLPKPILSKCTAEVDPVALSLVPRSKLLILKEKIGVKFDIREADQLKISGSLLQLQIFSLELEELVKNQQDETRRGLDDVGIKAAMAEVPLEGQGLWSSNAGVDQFQSHSEDEEETDVDEEGKEEGGQEMELEEEEENGEEENGIEAAGNGGSDSEGDRGHDKYPWMKKDADIDRSKAIINELGEDPHTESKEISSFRDTENAVREMFDRASDAANGDIVSNSAHPEGCSAAPGNSTHLPRSSDSSDYKSKPLYSKGSSLNEAEETTGEKAMRELFPSSDSKRAQVIPQAVWTLSEPLHKMSRMHSPTPSEHSFFGELNGICAEVDRYALDFMRKFYLKFIDDIEAKHGVKICYRKEEDKAWVKFAGHGSKNPSISEERAKCAFMEQYEKVCKQVVVERVEYNTRSVSPRLVSSCVGEISRASTEPLFFSTKSPGAITVVGARPSVSTLVGIIRLKLGLVSPPSEVAHSCKDKPSGKSRIDPSRVMSHQQDEDADEDEEEEEEDEGEEEQEEDEKMQSSTNQSVLECVDRETCKNVDPRSPPMPLTKMLECSDPASYHHSAKRPIYDDTDVLGKTLSVPQVAAEVAACREKPTSLYAESPKGRHHAEIPTYFKVHDLVIICKTSDITHVRESAVVCPCTRDLGAIGALGMAIECACDLLNLVKCKDSIRREHMSLEVTDVVAIRASGSLLCEYVIYIVTPRLTSSYSLEKTGSELCKAFKNVLKYANEKLRLKSIAVPSIGTGANGIPDDVCANAFINAVEEFCVERTTHILKRVVFVNLDESATQFFYVLFDQLLNPEGRSELPSGETGTETTEHSVTEPKQEAKESTFHHGEDPSDKDKLMMQKTDTRTTPRHQATVPKQDARRSTGRPVVMIPDDSTTQEFLASKRAVGATPDSHSFTSRNDITKRSQMDKTLRDQDDISETDLKQPFNENPSNAESSATVISRALNETGIDAKAPMSLKHSNEPNVANRESSSQDFLQGRTDKPSQRAHDSADVHIDTLGDPMTVKAYLPNNHRARKLMNRIEKAFKDKELFKFKNGKWRARIELKVRTSDGKSGHGYPDPDYLDRLESQLDSIQ